MSQSFLIPFYFPLTVTLDKNPCKFNYILAYTTQKSLTNTPYCNNSTTGNECAEQEIYTYRGNKMEDDTYSPSATTSRE